MSIEARPHEDMRLYRLRVQRATLDDARDDLHDQLRTILSHDDRPPLARIAEAAGVSRATLYGLLDPAYRERRNASR